MTKEVKFHIKSFDGDPISHLIKHLQDLEKEHGNIVLDVKEDYCGWERGQDEYFFIPNPYPENNI